MGKRLNLGLVGCGDIAGFTALVSRLVPRLRLAACCDTDLDRAQRFARRHGIPRAMDDYARLLSLPEVEAVYLAVPHHLHASMAEAAVRAGKPVLLEKPLARTLAEGTSLVREASASGVKVGVNYQYRYDRACHRLARAVQEGELGRVHAVRINVPWRREASYFDKSPWHRTWAQAGGGTLLTQGSHFLDVVLWALGGPGRSASGHTARPGFDVEVETLAQGVVEMESGALVQVCSSMITARERAVTIEAYGERGTAVYCNGPLPRVRFSGVRPRRYPLPHRGVHALHRSIDAFVRWVLDDEPFLVPAAAALPVLATVEALYRSAASGCREPVES